MFNNYYRGKRVLVTGHTGFKGAWLTQWLLDLGAQVTGLSIDIPTTPSLFETLKLKSKVNDVRADIGNFESLMEVFKKNQPEVVFHLAAQPLVRQSYEIPRQTFMTNVIGTVNVLEAQRHCSTVEAVVIVTTDKCYQNQEWVWGYRESDALGGHDPYSASKACAEIATNSFSQSYPSLKSRVSSVRAGNVIGGGDWALDRIVPDAMRAWLRENKLIIRAPKAVRPWQHVLEPLSAYLWIGSLLGQKQLKTGEAFNIGPRREGHISVEALLELLKRDWKSAGWDVEKSSTNPKETNFLSLSCDKAHQILGWSPVLTIEQSVKMTSDWYRLNSEGEKSMVEVTSNQISQFQLLSKENGKAFALN